MVLLKLAQGIHLKTPPPPSQPEPLTRPDENAVHRPMRRASSATVAAPPSAPPRWWIGAGRVEAAPS